MALIVVVVLGYLAFTWLKQVFGNKQLFDTTYTYNKAIVYFAGEMVEYELKSWKDYDGEQIQLVIMDGRVLLVSSYNTILVSESRK